ncbi:MAG: hypothetical protein ACRCTZ_03290 [Sarcina sp.]
MRNIIMDFNVELESIKKKTLKVSLFIKNLPEQEVLRLYKGKAKIVNANAFVPVKQDKNFMHFKIDKKDSLLIEYTVELETSSRFGILGAIKNDIIAFAGEQVFLMPVEALKLGKEAKENCFEITIDFKFKGFKNSMIPFANENNRIQIVAKNFSEMFELGKAPYVFTDTPIPVNSGLNLFANYDLSDDIKNNIKSIYNYYVSLFESKIDLNLTILKNASIRRIFAGASKYNIAISFDANNKQDYKFLSNKIFLSFITQLVDKQELLTPPNLWIVEGLSTYYENKSLEVLDIELKENLNISFDEEMKKLYRVYLYSTTKYEKIYNFPPLLDGGLKAYALIEYLYNIKAPVLIKLFEDNASLYAEDNMIKYLIGLTPKDKFLQPNMFKAILKEKVEEIAPKYIFGTETIPFNGDFTGDAQTIKPLLEDFEKIMATYFAFENLKPPVSEITEEDLKIFDHTEILSN